MFEHEKSGSDSHIRLEGGLPVFETQLERIEREQAEAKDRDKLYRDEQLKINRQQLWVNKLLMFFTCLLVLTSGIAAWISLYQARISRTSAEAAESAAKTAASTLKEMQIGQGATDTHTLAQQAVTQAAQTTKLAAAANAQAGELRDSVKQSGRLAEAAERANALNAESRRPWVGMADPIVMTKVLGGPDGIIEYTTKVRNFGDSPAFEVTPEVGLAVGSRSTNILPELEEACKKTEGRHLLFKVGETLFPGDTYSFPTEASPRQSLPKIPLSSTDPVYFFYGCVVYLDAQGISHHTRICQWTDKDNFKVGASFSSCSRPSAD